MLNFFDELPIPDPMGDLRKSKSKVVKIKIDPNPEALRKAILRSDEKGVQEQLAAGVDFEPYVYNAFSKWTSKRIKNAKIKQAAYNIFMMLYNAGAKFNSPLWFQSPLHKAVVNGELDIVETLIPLFLHELNKGDYEKKTPLKIAKKYFHFDIFIALHNAGATLDPTHDYADFISHAFNNDRFDIVELFINHPNSVPQIEILLWQCLTVAQDKLNDFLDCGIQIKNKGLLFKILHSPEINNKSEMVNKLISRGLDINEKAGGFGVLHYLMEENPFDQSLYQDMIDAKADINALYEGKGTPLELAAKSGNTEAIDLLTSNGAQVQTIKNCEPLLLSAFQSGNTLAIKALLEAGADPNELYKGSPIWAYFSKYHKRALILHCLLEHSKKLSNLAFDQNAVLHSALEYYPTSKTLYEKIIKLILKDDAVKERLFRELYKFPLKRSQLQHYWERFPHCQEVFKEVELYGLKIVEIFPINSQFSEEWRKFNNDPYSYLIGKGFTPAKAAAVQLLHVKAFSDAKKLEKQTRTRADLPEVLKAAWQHYQKNIKPVFESQLQDKGLTLEERFAWVETKLREAAFKEIETTTENANVLAMIKSFKENPVDMEGLFKGDETQMAKVRPLFTSNTHIAEMAFRALDPKGITHPEWPNLLVAQEDDTTVSFTTVEVKFTEGNATPRKSSEQVRMLLAVTYLMMLEQKEPNTQLSLFPLFVQMSEILRSSNHLYPDYKGDVPSCYPGCVDRFERIWEIFPKYAIPKDWFNIIRVKCLEKRIYQTFQAGLEKCGHDLDAIDEYCHAIMDLTEKTAEAFVKSEDNDLTLTPKQIDIRNVFMQKAIGNVEALFKEINDELAQKNRPTLSHVDLRIYLAPFFENAAGFCMEDLSNFRTAYLAKIPKPNLPIPLPRRMLSITPAFDNVRSPVNLTLDNAPLSPSNRSPRRLNRRETMVGN